MHTYTLCPGTSSMYMHSGKPVSGLTHALAGHGTLVVRGTDGSLHAVPAASSERNVFPLSAALSADVSKDTRTEGDPPRDISNLSLEAHVASFGHSNPNASSSTNHLMSVRQHAQYRYVCVADMIASPVVHAVVRGHRDLCQGVGFVQ